MASSSGTSSGSTILPPNSGSDEDLQLVMDQRKRKRMISNRESARRSRMRKQKHLDDLMAQVAQLRKENNQILTTYKLTTQQYLAVESENSVLRTQMMELSSRLQSLNEIINYMNVASNGYGSVLDGQQQQQQQNMMESFMMNPWNMNLLSANQPIMASPDMFLC